MTTGPPGDFKRLHPDSMVVTTPQVRGALKEQSDQARRIIEKGLEWLAENPRSGRLQETGYFPGTRLHDFKVRDSKLYCVSVYYAENKDGSICISRLQVYEDPETTNRKRRG